MLTLAQVSLDRVSSHAAATDLAGQESFAHDPRWIAAVSESLCPGLLEVFALEEGGETILLLPLVPAKSERRSGVRVLGTASDPHIPLTDIVVAPGRRNAETLGEALSQLAQGHPWDLLRFQRIRARAQLLEAIPGVPFRYALTDGGSSAYCDVSTPSALSALSKDHLRNIDRLKRRAERDHGVVAVESVTDGTVATTAYDRFLRIESSGWKGADGSGTALALDPDGARFFRNVLHRFQEVGRARLDFLTIGGRDAAVQLCIRTGGTWFIQKIGFDPEFRDVGPGGILLKAFLDEMTALPDVVEVNLATDPPWAARWRFQTEPCYTVLIYGRTWRGRLLSAGRTGKELLKSIRSRLPRNPSNAAR